MVGWLISYTVLLCSWKPVAWWACLGADVGKFPLLNLTVVLD